MVWSLFFLLGVNCPSSLVLNSHELSSSIGQNMWHFLWEFMGILMTFGWIRWIGLFSSLFFSLFFPDWETMQTSMEKTMEQYLWFFRLVLHMSRFFMVFGWIRLLWFWNWDVSLLVREKMEPYWKKYTVKQVMEYAHGSFRFFGMFFLHWCFHVFLNQGRTTRRSISTPKPEQTSSSKTTRISTQIATCFFRNHGITSMSISQRGGITMIKPSICPSIFQRLHFFSQESGEQQRVSNIPIQKP